MTPKEKAKELYDKYLPWVVGADRYSMGEIHHPYIAKQCALIVVDEIISINAESFDDWENNPHHYYSRPYWQRVKTEIEKL